MTFTLLFYLQSNTGDPTGTVCAIVFILAIVLIAVAVGADSNKKAQALAAARDSYHNSLIELKANPTNADLRQVTLGLGRI
jgi:hypothetical protein